MKVLLSEQQINSLIKNYDAVNPFTNFDIEKEMPTISKFARSMSNTGDIANALSGAGNTTGPLNTGKSTNVAFNTPNSSTSTPTPTIPNGSEMMNPLGHKVEITSPFGQRTSKVGTTNHKGVDLSIPSGSPVYAPLDGVVIMAKDTTPDRCGGFVKLDHGTIKTKFCHLSKWTVSDNQKVKKGQVIGYSGGGPGDPYRGVTTGAHLHYEILNQNDVAVNPVTIQNNLA